MKKTYKTPRSVVLKVADNLMQLQWAAGSTINTDTESRGTSQSMMSFESEGTGSISFD